MTRALNAFVGAQFTDPLHKGESNSILNGDYRYESALDATLVARDATYYNEKRLAQMSVNDKVYAVRIIEEVSGAGAVTPPVAQYDYTAVGLEVTFINNCYDPNGLTITYLWEFGDGQTSTAKDPVHTYASAGTRITRLTITNSGGAKNSTAKSVTVTA